MVFLLSLHCTERLCEDAAWVGEVRFGRSTPSCVRLSATPRGAPGKQEKAERERLEQLERQHATIAVQEYQRYIDLITSVHKTASPPVNWVRLAQSTPPTPPKHTRTQEHAARQALATFRPSITDKILRRMESKTTALKSRIYTAIAADEHEFETRQRKYEADQQDWKKTTELAKRVLSDRSAMLDIIRERNPFTAISWLGSAIEFKVDETGLLTATVNVHSEDVVPDQEFGFYKSGKLTSKKLPKSRYYEIYQDYVCGVVLRVAREICALLPVEDFIITAEDELLDAATGKVEPQPILSVYMDRITLEALNFERVDPSDAMRNVHHNMNFKKTQGFKPVAVVSVPRGA